MAVATPVAATTEPVVRPDCERTAAPLTWVRWVAVGAILVPFLAVAIRIWTHRNDAFIPMADYALLEMQLRDLPSHLPLLGAYSRFGWNHPGPIATYLIGLGYWLTGKYSLSMWIGGAAINATACVAVVLVGFRRLGQLGGVLATGALAVYLVYLGPLGMADPWNPIVSILPFLALMFCLWDAWCGGRWVWLAVAVLATFVVQSHVQYLAPTIAMSAVVLVGCVIRARRASGTERSSPWPVVGGAAAVLALLWLPPLVQQAIGRPGNLGTLADYLVTGRGQQHPWGESVSLAVREVTAPMSLFVDGRFNRVLTELPGTMPGMVTLAGVLLAFSVALVIVRRQGDLAGLFVVGAVGWGVAIVQCTRVEGPLWLYLLAWISAFGVVFAVFIMATLLSAVRTSFVSSNPSPPVRAVVATSALVLGSLVATVCAVIAPWRPDNEHARVAPLYEAVRRELPRSGPVLITTGGLPVDFQIMALSGMLVRDGIDVRGPDSLRLQYAWRTAGKDVPALRLQLIVVDPMQPPPELPNMTLYASGGTLALYQLP
jgi:hypothetical protein